MKSKEVNTCETLASLVLPQGMSDFFEITKVEEERNTDSKKLDILFPTVLNIYLDERDNRKGIDLGFKPNGFTEYATYRDYPIRDRKVVLHVRRRRYLDSDNHSIVLNEYPLKADGTEISVEFGLFFKEDPR